MYNECYKIFIVSWMQMISHFFNSEYFCSLQRQKGEDNLKFSKNYQLCYQVFLKLKFELEARSLHVLRNKLSLNLGIFFRLY